MDGPREEFASVRNRIGRAAAQLRELRDQCLLLVIVLGSAEGADVRLTGEGLVLAIDGDPRYTLLVDQASGRVVGERYDPRNGKRNDHSYVSAVAVVHASQTAGGFSNPAALVLLLREERRDGPTPCWGRPLPSFLAFP